MLTREHGSSLVGRDGRKALSGIASVLAARQFVVYQLVLFLEAGGPLTSSKLAKLIGRQVSTVSIHHGKLRTADVVRYDTSGKKTRYRLKR